MNSLQSKAIRRLTAQSGPTTALTTADTNALHIHLRQSIVDYLSTEKVRVSAQMVSNLVTGGLKSLDLWRLCINNDFTVEEVMAILETIALNRQSFDSLSLGGNQWIFNQRVVRGPLKKLFDGHFTRLETLRMQQIDTKEDLLNILKSCPRLKSLEVSLPCLTDRDIDRIEERIKSCPSVANIKELQLPSSFKQRALMKVLAIFKNLKKLKCVSFEQTMDLIDYSLKSSAKSSDTALRAKLTLSSLTSLTISQPMSAYAINRLVELCPRLKTLNVEVQKDNDLLAIARLPHIRKLLLRNIHPTPCQWAQVMPLLESIGRQLTGLSLEHFEYVDLTACAKLCPDLVQFSAQWFTLLGFIRPNTPSSQRDRHLKTPFSNLTHLRLRPLSGRSIPSDGCAFALTHASQLTHIELYSCFDLSDSDVQTLQSKNPMLNLRSLILRHGHKVTKEALNLLVSRSHRLEYIDCGIPLKKEDNVSDL